VERRRRKAPWIVLGIIAIVAFLLGLAQDQEVLRIKSAVEARDARFLDYVASLTNSPVSRGDRFEVLQNGDGIFPPMLAAIKGAKQRISFESFIWWDGELSRQFTAAFADAALRGVAVRIVLDAVGAAKLPDDAQAQLRGAGVRTVWFNPVRPWTLEEANYRTHRKLLAVDGSVAFTGGVALADHWLGNAQDKDHWRDTQFRITGPLVRSLEASFYENWLESGGGEAPALDPEDPAPAGRSRSMVIWSNATGGASNIKLLYLLSLGGARRTVDIQSPYFILDESSRWSFTEMRRRGVRVRVLTEGDASDVRSVKAASRYGYQTLLDEGHDIHEFQPTMMHVKVMVVDGIWSVIGTANFDNRSFELNDELAVAVHDPELAATLSAAFEADLKRSTRLTADEWRRRSVFQKVRQWFWSFFGEVF
jgi:cardiolipin synthase